MTAVEEQTPLQTEVPAETSLSAIRTAGPDTSLLQNFLELPVPVVLLTLWLVGAALMGLCALMLYELLWTLLGMLAGARVSEKNSSRKLADQARLPTPRYRIGMRAYASEFPRTPALGSSVNRGNPS